MSLLVFALLVSCATSFDRKGVYHVVQKGETIQRLASFYRVPVQDLAEWNDIQDNEGLKRGMKLYIPARPSKRSFKKLPKGETSHSYSEPIKTYRGQFIWPVDGGVSSGFGIRNGRRHDGIDIPRPKGTPIHAAAAGKVVFANKLSGYGNTIILKNDDDFFTTYAHCSSFSVKKGQKVKQGEVIAKVGRTGRATGNHLHFEIRNGQKARNPLFFLPVRK